MDCIQLDTYPFHFSVKSECQDVLNNIRTLYHHTVIAEQLDFSDFNVSVNFRRFAGIKIPKHVEFCLSGFSPFAYNPANHATAVLEWGMNWCVANHIMTYQVLHSATVARHNRGVMLCGASGSGKSTLCAALMAENWRLLTDELSLLHCDKVATVSPFVRPVSVKEKAIAVLQQRYPFLVFGDIATNTDKGTVSHVRPSDLSWQTRHLDANIELIVFPKFNPQLSSPLVSDVSQVDAIHELIEQSFNFNTLGKVALQSIVDLSERAKLVAIEYANLDDAIAEIERLMV